MKSLVLLVAGILLLDSGFARAADTDGVPDSADNCKDLNNGPAELSNQVDSDIDGYGNACDADFDNNLLVSVSDLSQLLAAIGCAAGSGSPGCLAGTAETDLDGDGQTTDQGASVGDFAIFMNSLFGHPVGRSGLNCAGTTPCP